MTRRKHPSQLIRHVPPNPVNLAHKLRRLRIEIVAITASIDRALDHLARAGKPENEAS